MENHPYSPMASLANLRNWRKKKKKRKRQNGLFRFSVREHDINPTQMGSAAGSYATMPRVRSLLANLPPAAYRWLYIHSYITAAVPSAPLFWCQLS